ncbi:interleukin-6 receptor subunit beta-like isoform X2 [Mobula hypostoma]|uniref:interleukin-6 receptor subunit beta-like isoform X2 n=1 Tax=Mobula hypostoma TaxID=723540 RepID=UPI002FC3881C
MFLQRIWWLVVTSLSIQIGECLKIDNPLEGSAYIVPESPVIENGSQIQASCILSKSFVKEHRVDANQVFWKLKENRIPSDHYTIVNNTVSNVTLTISTVGVALLTCNVQYNEDHVGTVFGIQVTTGLLPEKPKNLTCITYYDRNMTCSWDPGKETYLQTSYYLKLSIKPGPPKHYVLKDGVNNSYAIEYPYIYYFVLNNISVEAKNSLGTVISDPIYLDPVDVIKPDPPKIKLIKQVPGMSRVLTVHWENPILPVTYGLKYNLRYRIMYTHEWIQVPSEDTNLKRNSFLVQGLIPFTAYSFSIRCKNFGNSGYWSNWSSEKIKKTPETNPSRGPPIWRTIKSLTFPNRRIDIIWKELDKSDANGIILGYQLKIMQKDSLKVQIVNTKDLEYSTTLSQSGYEISLIANNSAGASPMSILIVPDTREPVRPPVSKFSAYRQDGRLMVEWEAPKYSVSGYIIEWCEDFGKDLCHKPTYWQHEKKTVNKTFLKDHVLPLKRYRITSYPLYSGHPGASLSTLAYLQQDRPINGPSVHLKHVGKNEVEIVWSEVPVNERRGFITNYTIFYRSVNSNESSFVVDSKQQQFVLKSLKGNTLYVVRVMASTIKGGTNSSEVNFTTLNFAKGEIEAIVVPICLCFLLITMGVTLLCFKNRHLIKTCVWPNVPDAANSRIVDWSSSNGNHIKNNLGPSDPVNLDGFISDVTIIEADADNKYSSNEDDMKQLSSLKKEKSTSGEHSSGIGGSSCMSSPRQSVSDSDSELAQNTTSSTVQYSTVLVSDTGYKCQQPSGQVFARSESTQPLLENEEKPDEHSYGNFGSRSTEVKRQYFKQNCHVEEPILKEVPSNEGEILGDMDEDSSLRLSRMEISDQNSEESCPVVEEFSSCDNQTVVKLDLLGFDGCLETDQQSYMPQAVKHNSYMPQSK